jgi:hypothetical protein
MNLFILDKLIKKIDNVDITPVKSLLEICFNSLRALQASKTIVSVDL